MRVAPRQPRQERTHRRLIAPDQLAESVLVLARQNPGDKIGVGEGHVLSGWLPVGLILLFHKPYNQECHANEEHDPSSPRIPL